MSINTAHASAVPGSSYMIWLFGGERLLLYNKGVEMSLDPDGSVAEMKGNKKGRLFLTTHRMVFLNDSSDKMMSMSMPFYTLHGLELEQPVFGANYIKGNVRAEPNGNWSGSAKFKLWFKHGGAIEYGRALLECGRLASRNGPPPPAYSPCPSGEYYVAPCTAYAPPAYGWVPYGTFPDRPAANEVYMSQAPPPYPGIDAPTNQNTNAYAAASAPPPPGYRYTDQTQYHSNGYASPTEAAKAAEAGVGYSGAPPPQPVAQLGYYAPQDPNMVYAPPPHAPSSQAQPSAPPAYDDVFGGGGNKKSN